MPDELSGDARESALASTPRSLHQVFAVRPDLPGRCSASDARRRGRGLDYAAKNKKAHGLVSMGFPGSTDFGMTTLGFALWPRQQASSGTMPGSPGRAGE